MFRRNCADIIENLDTALNMMHRTPIARQNTQQEASSGIDDLIADRPSASGGAPLHSSPMHAHTLAGEKMGRQSVQVAENGEYSYIVPPVVQQNGNTDVMWLLDSKSNDQRRNATRGIGPLGGRSDPSGAISKSATRMHSDIERSSTPVLPGATTTRQQVDRNGHSLAHVWPQA